MVLPKYFLLTARKILILPKSSKLGGAIAPPAPPAGTAMRTAIKIETALNKVNSDKLKLYLNITFNCTSNYIIITSNKICQF